MWIRNKRTGKYECVSPAVGKYKINLRPNIWKDRNEKHCKSCSAGNHREKTTCRICGEKF
jgi:hypothetical protein